MINHYYLRYLSLSSILLRPLHLWFHTDLLIFVCNFDYALRLIKSWFILCVRIVFSATRVTFEGYREGRSKTSWKTAKRQLNSHFLPRPLKQRSGLSHGERALGAKKKLPCEWTPSPALLVSFVNHSFGMFWPENKRLKLIAIINF